MIDFHMINGVYQFRVKQTVFNQDRSMMMTVYFSPSLHKFVVSPKDTTRYKLTLNADTMDEAIIEAQAKVKEVGWEVDENPMNT